MGPARSFVSLLTGSFSTPAGDNPPRTRLLREAEARGCSTLDGLGMLVNQGVLGIRLWTGRQPDAAAMRQTLADIFA